MEHVALASKLFGYSAWGTNPPQKGPLGPSFPKRSTRIRKWSEYKVVSQAREMFLTSVFVVHDLIDILMMIIALLSHSEACSDVCCQICTMSWGGCSSPGVFSGVSEGNCPGSSRAVF